MPRIGITQESKISTRNSYTTVDAKFTVNVDGKELPNMAVLGEALEEAIKVFQAKITESYNVVPPRVETPIAEPYAARN